MQSDCNILARGIHFTCSLSLLKVTLDFCAADCSCWPSKRDHCISFVQLLQSCCCTLLLESRPVMLGYCDVNNRLSLSQADLAHDFLDALCNCRSLTAY
jgi:hypothetical protein